MVYGYIHTVQYCEAGPVFDQLRFLVFYPQDRSDSGPGSGSSSIKSRLSIIIFVYNISPSFLEKNSFIFNYLFINLPWINVGRNEENIIQNCYCFIYSTVRWSRSREPEPYLHTDSGSDQNVPAPEHWTVHTRTVYAANVTHEGGQPNFHAPLWKESIYFPELI